MTTSPSLFGARFDLFVGLAADTPLKLLARSTTPELDLLRERVAAIEVRAASFQDPRATDLHAPRRLRELDALFDGSLYAALRPEDLERELAAFEADWRSQRAANGEVVGLEGALKATLRDELYVRIERVGARARRALETPLSTLTRPVEAALARDARLLRDLMRGPPTRRRRADGGWSEKLRQLLRRKKQTAQPLVGSRLVKVNGCWLERRVELMLRDAERHARKSGLRAPAFFLLDAVYPSGSFTGPGVLFVQPSVPKTQRKVASALRLAGFSTRMHGAGDPHTRCLCAVAIGYGRIDSAAWGDAGAS